MRKFIYPTVMNSLYLFCVLQLWPIGMSLYRGSDFWLWVRLEAVILGLLCLMPLKPLGEMDERERAVELQWKNRMLECTYPFILLPIALLSMKPDASGWMVLNMFTVPVFGMLVILSVLLRRDQGGFFYGQQLD